MSAGGRALRVAKSRRDSRPGWGGVEAKAHGPASSGWVSMASGSVDGSWRAAVWAKLPGAVGAAASASGALGTMRGRGTRRAMQCV